MGVSTKSSSQMYINNNNNNANNVNNNNTHLMGSNGFTIGLSSNNNATTNNDDLQTTTIGEFYRNGVIFVTGATGFVGKALVEKLLRSCDLIEVIYVLIRTKRGMSAEQRLKELFKNPVFNKIKEKDADLLNKVKPIEGDVSLPNLGLNDTDRALLIESVNIVFHSAATVRFNEELKVAVTLNTLGTQRILDLCTSIKRLKSFVHVSTAYSNADKRIVDEIVYKPPYDPNLIINCIEHLPDGAVDMLADKLLGKHPNTYTLTKAMAEQLVWEYSALIPATIVRPSIVTCAWKEPFPGWVDNVSGITGILMEIGRGSIKSIIANENLIMDMIPVDVVVNTLVTAAWHTVANRSNTMRVYNCTSGSISPILWGDWGNLATKAAIRYPSKYLNWYPGFSFRTNRVMHWICAVLFHTTPAFLLDMLLMCTKHKPMMYTICKKTRNALKAGEFCSLNEWDFKVSSLKMLVRDVKDARDGDQFNVDVSKENGFNWDEYSETYMLGIRQFVLKDDLGSLPQAKTRLNRFYWANKAFQLLIFYMLLKFTIF